MGTFQFSPIKTNNPRSGGTEDRVSFSAFSTLPIMIRNRSHPPPLLFLLIKPPSSFSFCPPISSVSYYLLLFPVLMFRASPSCRRLLLRRRPPIQLSPPRGYTIAVDVIYIARLVSLSSPCPYPCVCPPTGRLFKKATFVPFLEAIIPSFSPLLHFWGLGGFIWKWKRQGDLFLRL